MRTVRKAMEIGLPVAGIVLILGGVLIGGTRYAEMNLSTQVLIVLVGILLIEAGTWNLADPFMPNERKFLALREEADRFIDLVRKLNAAALRRKEDGEEAAREMEDVATEMHEAVDRMTRLAGKTDSELEGEARVT